MSTKTGGHNDLYLASYVKLQNALACVDSAERSLHDAGSVDPAVLANLQSIKKAAETAMAQIESAHNSLIDREVA